jgi:hypothetical protein
MTDKPSWIAGFDSAAGFMIAIAGALGGNEFRYLGQPAWLEPLARAANLLPRPLARAAFALGGVLEAIGPSRLGRVRSDEIGAWAGRAYAPGPYPRVFLGSSSGALVNLCAALRVPWLPQTVLVPVRNLRGRADDPRQSCALGRRIAPHFLAADPDLALHHMHDPVQDRVMANWMSYFRVKRLRLGADYERFLLERLAPGGTIVLVDCRKRWPVHRVAERHVFQFGAVGGAEPRDYFPGTDRTRRFLRQQGSGLDGWDPTRPDGDAPEAEWGFDPSLAQDAERFAARHGFRVARLTYDEPGALGPLVADLHRWWYARLGWPADARLLVQSFILTAPARALMTGSVPLWTVFNTQHDLDALAAYLDRHAFDEVAVSLFPNGVRALGQPTTGEWRRQLDRARRRGFFLGVDERRFPFDFAGLANYHRAVRALPAAHPELPRLGPDELRDYLARSAAPHGVVVEGF